MSYKVGDKVLVKGTRNTYGVIDSTPMCGTTRDLLYGVKFYHIDTGYPLDSAMQDVAYYQLAEDILGYYDEESNIIPESRVTNELGGSKDSKGKAPMFMVPLECVAEIARVMEYGGKRYGQDNWKLVHEVEYHHAIMRHEAAIQRGELYDESGFLHTAHVACNAIFNLYKHLHKDDIKDGVVEYKPCNGEEDVV